jgi:Dyp-type peroxidase family
VPVTPTSTRLAYEVRADIQGFITSGYGHLSHAAYLFVQINDGVGGRRWLGRLVPSVTSARPWPTGADGAKVKPSVSLNIAFSAEGLAAFGLPAQVLCTFPPEFQEGIAQEERSRILGDTEESDPAVWELGGSKTPPIHAILLIHAVSAAELEAACRAQRALLEETSGAVAELPGSMQKGQRPEADCEPFGFHDGVAQPSIAGISGDGVPTGEFILGYQNHYQIVPPTPTVPASVDPDGLLQPLANPYHASEGLRDLGINGTYVVYRKLQQDVSGFWQFMKREAVRATGAEDTGYMVWLAARMVGRWPSGAPLVLARDADDPRAAERDDFLYSVDPDGLACPFGAHIRRANPRDAIKPYPTAESLSMSEAHRLLRRARAFGAALFDAQVLRDPTAAAGRKTLLELHDDGEARGIHFFCVNASIKSQFEFVQQTWCNNPRFGGLNDGKDPIIGDNGRPDQPSSYLTIPRRPLRARTAALPRFVTVRAGAYLFMPSVTALRFLAAFGDNRAKVSSGGTTYAEQAEIPWRALQE